MTILEEAESLVSGDRQSSYGHPKENAARIAEFWSVFLGIDVSAQDVCSLMILLKIARDMGTPQRDTIVDIAGYARMKEMIGG